LELKGKGKKLIGLIKIINQSPPNWLGNHFLICPPILPKDSSLPIFVKKKGKNKKFKKKRGDTSSWYFLESLMKNI